MAHIRIIQVLFVVYMDNRHLDVLFQQRHRYTTQSITLNKLKRWTARLINVCESVQIHVINKFTPILPVTWLPEWAKIFVERVLKFKYQTL